MAAKRILGAAALAATLLLSVPGVQVVRADGPLVSELPSGPMCQASAPPGDPAVLAALAEKLRRAEAQRAAAGEAQVVALDNGGHHYGGAQGGVIQALQGEQ